MAAKARKPGLIQIAEFTKLSDRAEWARTAQLQDEVEILENLRLKQELRLVEMIREHRELNLQKVALGYLIADLRKELVQRLKD